MRTLTLIALGALALTPARANAQVHGTIIIGGYPVGGVIRIGEPPPPPPRRVVIVERHAPRVIVVERWKHHKHHRHCRHQRYDRRIVWWDRYDDVYYDRRRPGLIEIEVYAHDGHYYRPDRARDRRDDRDRDRWEDRDRRWGDDGDEDRRWERR